MADTDSEDRRRISLILSTGIITHLDVLRKEWGLSGRGAVLERLLEEIFEGIEPEEDPDEDGGDAGEGQAPSRPSGADEPSSSPTAGTAPPRHASIADGHPAAPAAVSASDSQATPAPHHPDGDIDDQTALILIGRGPIESLRAALESEEEKDREHPAGGAATESAPRRGGSGIDLPGFVQRRSVELKRSFGARGDATRRREPAPWPPIPAETIRQALETARNHWADLYGKRADATVLEAAMVWLATDIWRQSDQSDGRTFTWTAACEFMREVVPGWSDGPPSFERVLVTAGLLEDPFSGETLPLRIPTLIRRFVHRFRRRRRGTSFQTLEHTMTLQGALRLLELPTEPGHRLTLGQIREAYRELAMNHHPDSGGSAETMRRLNEAYQLLKELYRREPGQEG